MGCITLSLSTSSFSLRVSPFIIPTLCFGYAASFWLWHAHYLCTVTTNSSHWICSHCYAPITSLGTNIVWVSTHKVYVQLIGTKVAFKIERSSQELWIDFTLIFPGSEKRDTFLHPVSSRRRTLGTFTVPFAQRIFSATRALRASFHSLLHFTLFHTFAILLLLFFRHTFTIFCLSCVCVCVPF